MKRIALIGGGGHARSCIDAIESVGLFSVVGIIEATTFQGAQVYGIPVIGSDDDLSSLAPSVDAILVAIGQIGLPGRRLQLFEIASQCGIELPAIVALSAYVSPRATLGRGSIAMQGSTVGPSAVVGDNCIINSHSLVDHDAVIGSHTHIATGAILNGGVIIGERCFIGSGTIVHQGVHIADGSVVPSGSIVRSSIDPGTTLGRTR